MPRLSGLQNVDFTSNVPPPPKLKVEKLTPLGDSDMDSIELTFESPAVFIGSLLCQTN